MPALKWLVFKYNLGCVCVNLVGGKKPQVLSLSSFSFPNHSYRAKHTKALIGEVVLSYANLSNVKYSTKNKPLTVCTCWNLYLWMDLWHDWLAFWGQHLCSWVNCILGIGADIRVLTQKHIFFFPWFCLYLFPAENDCRKRYSVCSQRLSALYDQEQPLHLLQE